MKTVIEMARQAGIRDCTCNGALGCLERFAELIRADEREKYKWDIHSCGPTCKRYACVATREAVQAEREVCAYKAGIALLGADRGLANRVDQAIRNRSNT